MIVRTGSRIQQNTFQNDYIGASCLMVIIPQLQYSLLLCGGALLVSLACKFITVASTVPVALSHTKSQYIRLVLAFRMISLEARLSISVNSSLLSDFLT